MALEEVGGLVLLLDEFEATDNVIWPQLFSAVVEVLHLWLRWLELLHEVVLLLYEVVLDVDESLNTSESYVLEVAVVEPDESLH